MKQTKTMRAGKSDYTYIVERGFIAITDLNRGGRSVTNDAENVIQDLVAAGIDVNHYTILYRDSTGRWDQMYTTQNGEFSGFIAVAGASFEDAKKRVLDRLTEEMRVGWQAQRQGDRS